MVETENLRAIVRAVRVLHRRIGVRRGGVSEEKVATELHRYLRGGNVQFVAQFMEDCSHFMRKAEQSRTDIPNCQGCGNRILSLHPRMRHCNSKCRQAAYRKRVTDKSHVTCSASVTVTDEARASVEKKRNEQGLAAP